MHAADTRADRLAIEAIVARFLQAFSQPSAGPVDLAPLRALCLPQVVIVKCCGEDRQIYDLEAFIAPREALLNSGAITGFHEYPVSGSTELFGQIAQHFCRYEKSWQQDGRTHRGRGMKTVQLVKMAQGWKISALAWDDERDGLALPTA